MNAMQIIKEGEWGVLFDTCANMTLVLVKFTINIEYILSRWAIGGVCKSDCFTQWNDCSKIIL